MSEWNRLADAYPNSKLAKNFVRPKGEKPYITPEDLTDPSPEEWNAIADKYPWYGLKKKKVPPKDPTKKTGS